MKTTITAVLLLTLGCATLDEPGYSRLPPPFPIPAMVGRVGENLQPVFLEQMAALDNDLPTDTGPTERACIWAESGMLFVESVLRTQWPEWHNTENTFRATKRRPPLPTDRQPGAGLHRYLSSDVYSPAEMRRSGIMENAATQFGAEARKHCGKADPTRLGRARQELVRAITKYQVDVERAAHARSFVHPGMIGPTPTSRLEAIPADLAFKMALLVAVGVIAAETIPFEVTVRTLTWAVAQ